MITLVGYYIRMFTCTSASMHFLGTLVTPWRLLMKLDNNWATGLLRAHVAIVAAMDG